MARVTKSEIGRFKAIDDNGNTHIIVHYRTFEESDEIRSDRSAPDPVIGECFKTLEGRDVDKIGDDVFQILRTNIIVRKV